jgi:hypothetical protein
VGGAAAAEWYFLCHYNGDHFAGEGKKIAHNGICLYLGAQFTDSGHRQSNSNRIFCTLQKAPGTLELYLQCKIRDF